MNEIDMYVVKFFVLLYILMFNRSACCLEQCVNVWFFNDIVPKRSSSNFNM